MNYARPDCLLEPESLQQALDDPKLLIFDATVHLVPADKGYRAQSGLADYQAAHIPGAVFMDQIRAVSDTSTGLGFSLPAPEALEAALRDLGCNDDSRIVVYSSGHMMWATRAWWLLHYAGLEEVAVLNGGLRGWQEAGFETDAGDVAPSPGSFTIRPRPERFVGKVEVLAAIGDDTVCTVNALPSEVYSGEAEMSYGRKGHITGSINVPYDGLLDRGRFLPPDALRRALDDGGLLGPERVFAYCGGGISATIDAFACLLAGKDDVAVYDGSMSEWVRDEALPMTEGREPG